MPSTVARRLLVISHAAAIEANQLVYRALQDLNWQVHLVIPRGWIDGFSGHPFETVLMPALRHCGRRVPVIRPGRQQRHVYLTRPGALVHDVRPCVAFIEEEPFSASAWQWSRVLGRREIPFGVQSDENLERALPLPARIFRRRVMSSAAFVAARSPRAAELISGVHTELVPHAVAQCASAPRPPGGTPFVVGYAGRLVEQKGIRDLIEAVDRLPEVHLLVVGDGELRPEIEAAAERTGRIELLTSVRHARMPDVYARMNVLVLPSRTTSTWAEQFGRVLVEAMSSGIPVVGSSSGEIPWVVTVTGGGVIFPEGDVDALTRAIAELREDPARRKRLAAAGGAAVDKLFSIAAVARTLDRIFTELAAQGRLS
jgi:glycosyltransferase involved in cell wall biosynthesis